jgi:arsenate reductase (thioredoxin)
MARVLFVCKQNAGRSQMSDALFKRLVEGRHESRSAGTRPAENVHPVVVEAMREVGIDLRDHQPSRLTEDLAGWADLVVTMGCGDECPYIPAKKYVDWELTDPAGQPIEVVRSIRDDIARRVAELARQLPDPVRSLPGP